MDVRQRSSLLKTVPLPGAELLQVKGEPFETDIHKVVNEASKISGFPVKPEGAAALLFVRTNYLVKIPNDTERNPDIGCSG